MSTATDILAKYLAAEAAVLQGRSFAFGERTLTMADLPDIRQGRKEWEQRVAAENARAIKAPTIGGLSYALGNLSGRRYESG